MRMIVWGKFPPLRQKQALDATYFFTSLDESNPVFGGDRSLSGDAGLPPSVGVRIAAVSVSSMDRPVLSRLWSNAGRSFFVAWRLENELALQPAGSLISADFTVVTLSMVLRDYPAKKFSPSAQGETVFRHRDCRDSVFCVPKYPLDRIRYSPTTIEHRIRTADTRKFPVMASWICTQSQPQRQRRGKNSTAVFAEILFQFSFLFFSQASGKR